MGSWILSSLVGIKEKPRRQGPTVLAQRLVWLSLRPYEQIDQYVG